VHYYRSLLLRIPIRLLHIRLLPISRRSWRIPSLPIRLIIPWLVIPRLRNNKSLPTITIRSISQLLILKIPLPLTMHNQHNRNNNQNNPSNNVPSYRSTSRRRTTRIVIIVTSCIIGTVKVCAEIFGAVAVHVAALP
jgi:hypothetical protein